MALYAPTWLLVIVREGEITWFIDCGSVLDLSSFLECRVFAHRTHFLCFHAVLPLLRGTFFSYPSRDYVLMRSIAFFSLAACAAAFSLLAHCLSIISHPGFGLSIDLFSALMNRLTLAHYSRVQQRRAICNSRCGRSFFLAILGWPPSTARRN